MKRVTFSDDSAWCSPTPVKRRRFSHVRPGDDEDDDTPHAREDLSRKSISERLKEAQGKEFTQGIYRALVTRDRPWDVERIRAKLLSPRDHFADDDIGDDGYPTPGRVRWAIEYHATYTKRARKDRYIDTVWNPKP